MELAGTLDVLQTRLRVRTDRPEIVQPFLTVFAAFRTDDEGATAATGPRNGAVAAGTSDRAAVSGSALPSTTIDVVVNDADGLYEDSNRRVPLAGGTLRASQVYNLLYTTLVRSMGDVYLLHAAVLARDGRTYLVSGPSGSGKTTLARALTTRGFELLSDDLAPLALADGKVHPFPRALGVVPGGTGDDPAGLKLGDKLFVDPATLGVRMGATPLPPAAVAIMNPYTGDAAVTPRLSLAVLHHADALRDALKAGDGIRLRTDKGEGGCTLFEVELNGAEAIARAEELLARHDADLLFHCRGYGARKVYADAPVIEGLSARDAAAALLREVLNREPASALMQRLDGKLAGALFEVMGLLDGVACYRLTPSDIEATADLLAERFRAAGPAPA